MKWIMLLWIIWAQAAFAADPDYSDGVSAHEALDLINQTVSPFGYIAELTVSPLRQYPPCDSTPIVRQFQGSWETATLICASPDWKRSLRTGIKDHTPTPRAVVQVGQSAQQVVLSKSLAKGAIITPNDVTLAPVSDATVQGFNNVSQIIGRRLDTNLGQGRAVLARHLEQDWLVSPNEPVQILYEIAGITVFAPGISLDKGQLGELVWVTNTTSSKRVRAFVADRNKVLVQAKIN